MATEEELLKINGIEYDRKSFNPEQSELDYKIQVLLNTTSTKKLEVESLELVIDSYIRDLEDLLKEANPNKTPEYCTD